MNFVIYTGHPLLLELWKLRSLRSETMAKMWEKMNP